VRVHIERLVIDGSRLGEPEQSAVREALQEALAATGRERRTGRGSVTRHDVDLGTVEWGGSRRPHDLGRSVGAALAAEVGS
jgi:hypothetical protein